ncbi:hypothetical protein BKA62DRAFT_480257 [Auriculariales sp. MPI-PUGE-AT-0066]|nr:hypothetical protein BKA62DRAFT_480257 [Auriculariales sp. MPI-PUGE-AT-0066]
MIGHPDAMRLLCASLSMVVASSPPQRSLPTVRTTRGPCPVLRGAFFQMILFGVLAPIPAPFSSPPLVYRPWSDAQRPGSDAGGPSTTMFDAHEPAGPSR